MREISKSYLTAVMIFGALSNPISSGEKEKENPSAEKESTSAEEKYTDASALWAKVSECRKNTFVQNCRRIPPTKSSFGTLASKGCQIKLQECDDAEKKYNDIRNGQRASFMQKRYQSSPIPRNPKDEGKGN